MNNAIATFLHFISDNNSSIPVHVIREDANDPASSNLMMNAVNIQFIVFDFRVGISTLQAVIDVVNDSENAAIDWTNALWAVLNSAFYTTLLNYSGSVPIATGSNLMWGIDKVRFKKVASDQYTHLTCTLPLQFHS